MEFLKFLISLFVVVDPVFASIIVSSLVVSYGETERIAFRSSVTFLIAFTATLFFGRWFLNLIGISVSSIKIFGGLILLHMAFQMLQANPPKMKHTSREANAVFEKGDVSIIPIGIPILFGPGAFTTVLIFREEVSSLFGFLQLLIAGLVLSSVIYFLLLNSLSLAKRLGETGMGVTVRVFGLFVGALGSQFVVEGIKRLWLQG